MAFEISTTLKKLMLRHGNMSISDLAKATGLPQPTLYQLYVGTTKKKKKKTLSILSDYFKIKVKQLTGEEKLPFYLPETMKKQLGIHAIPLLTWDDLYHWQDKVDASNTEEFFTTKKSVNLRFAIKVINSEMAPTFPKGSILIFENNKKITNNDFSIIFFNQQNRFFIRKISTANPLLYSNPFTLAPNKEKKEKLQSKDIIVATLIEARLYF